MADINDTIGVTRHHRWVSVVQQAKALRDRCRVVLTLDKNGFHRVPAVTRDELMRLVRPGTTVEFLHCFLLADPRRRRIPGGMKADFHAAVAQIVDKRGGILVDVDTGLSTADPGHRRALIALAEDQIGRSNRGLRSAANGARSKGRPAADFDKQQLANAKAIWRNVKDYPTWASVEAALKAEVPGFTTARAFRLWRGRR